MRTALISGIAVVLAIFATIAVFMLSLSEPALRIPLMAVMTFGAMFLSRASPLGPVFFVAGFIVAYGLTLGDQVLGLALQPATAGNAPQFELPEIFFVPPDRRAGAFPAMAEPGRRRARSAADRRQPADRARPGTPSPPCAGRAVGDVSALLRGRERSGTPARSSGFRRHRAAAQAARSRRPAPPRPGPPGLGRLVDRRHRPARPAAARLVARRGQRSQSAASQPRAPAAEAERALQDGKAPSAEPVTITATGAARPLADAISRTLRAIRETLAGTPPGQETHDAAEAPHRLLAPDAFSNPEYVRFALKVTLAVMICYFVMSMTDWPGIHTCVITAFFVALGTVGETLHKATLRFVGCLIGAGLGLGAILLLMPDMTDLGDLFLLLAPVTLLAAWVGYGSERISYAGWQIGLAFYLVVLQGYGPTIDMYTARDRTIGILFGNIVVFVIFTTIWPVSVANVVRTHLARALERLAALVDLGAQTSGEISPAARSAAAAAFGQAIAQARAVLVNDPFETREVRRAAGRRTIDATVVEQVGRLFIPVSAILDLRADLAVHDLPQPTQDALRTHHQALAAWFRQAASWTRSGEGAGEVVAGLPEPPTLSGVGDHLTAFATWYGVLHQDIRKILDEVGPQPQPVTAPSARGRIACYRLGSDALPWPDARCSAPATTRATWHRLRPTPHGNSSHPKKRRHPLQPPQPRQSGSRCRRTRQSSCRRPPTSTPTMSIRSSS